MYLFFFFFVRRQKNRTSRRPGKVERRVWRPVAAVNRTGTSGRRAEEATRRSRAVQCSVDGPACGKDGGVDGWWGREKTRGEKKKSPVEKKRNVQRRKKNRTADICARIYFEKK